jgi:hypothetical protein
MILVLSAALMFAVAGCGKKEEPKAPETGSTSSMPPGMGGEGGGMPPGMGGEGGGMPPGMGGEGGGMPAGMGGKAAAPKTVVVPDSVKKTWPAAKILIKKKSGGDAGKTYEIKADGSVTIPGTKIKVEVGQYLPDFFMDGQTITSKSDVQINPTVRLTITEGDKELYKGWAFEKYPDAHPFVNQEYSVTLVGGVKG